MSGILRVIAFDLPERRPSLKSKIYDYAKPVAQTLESLTIDKCVVLGESMGGMVAIQMCLSFPEKVTGLILSNSIYDRRMRSFGLNMSTFATAVHFLAFLPIGDRRRRGLLEWVGKNRGFIFDPSEGNAELIDYLLAKRKDMRASAFADRFIAVANTDFSRSLDKIGVPTLIIRGEEDRFVGENVANYLSRKSKDSKLALIKGAGHCSPLTAHARTNEVIKEWLFEKGFCPKN